MNNPDGVTAVAADTMAPKGRPGKCLIIPLPVGSSVYVLPVGSSVLCRRCLSYWAPPTQPATPTAKAPPTFKNFILCPNCIESMSRYIDRTYLYNFTAVCRYLCENMNVLINTSHLSVKISTVTITVNCYTVFNVYI